MYSEKSIEALAKKYCAQHDGLSITWGPKGIAFDGFYFIEYAAFDETDSLKSLFDLCLSRYLTTLKEF